ncbi:hypothetical protein ACTFIZ_004618 [Dictyostelium cf. discoideum]
MNSNKDICISYNDQNDKDSNSYIRIFLEGGIEIQIGNKENKILNVPLNQDLIFMIFSRLYLGLKGSIRINIDNNNEISCTNTIDTPISMDFTYHKINNNINFIITNKRKNLNKVENNSFFTFEKPTFEKNIYQKNENSLEVVQINSTKKPIIVEIGNTRRVTIPPIRKVIAKEEIDSNGKIIKKPTVICNFSKLSSVTYGLTTYDKNGNELEKGYVTITLNENSTFSSKIFEIDYKKSKMPPNLNIKTIQHNGKGTEFIFNNEHCLVGTAAS